jgi:hypothetical protein
VPYYYIRILDRDENNVPTDKIIALRSEKASGPREACKLAFGVIYDQPTNDSVHYKCIGIRKPAYLSNKRRHELQTEKEGWLPIPKHGA